MSASPLSPRLKLLIARPTSFLHLRLPSIPSSPRRSLAWPSSSLASSNLPTDKSAFSSSSHGLPLLSSPVGPRHVQSQIPHPRHPSPRTSYPYLFPTLFSLLFISFASQVTLHYIRSFSLDGSTAVAAWRSGAAAKLARPLGEASTSDLLDLLSSRTVRSRRLRGSCGSGAACHFGQARCGTKQARAGWYETS